MRKKKTNKELIIPGSEVLELQKGQLNELESNPKYSLDVDPEGKYNLNPVQKSFITNYVNFKNVNTAAEVSGYNQDDANKFFVSYACQQEIRRINMALYQRRFASKLISIDEISGYLSSLLTDEYVPLADQLSSTEKLKVVDTLIRLNEMKQNAMKNPAELMNSNIDTDLKNMSITTIQQLIVQANEPDGKKNMLLQTVDDKNVLTPEERSYLETLSTTELIKIVNDINKEGGDKK